MRVAYVEIKLSADFYVKIGAFSEIIMFTIFQLPQPYKPSLESCAFPDWFSHFDVYWKHTLLFCPKSEVYIFRYKIVTITDI